jgi:endonuclease G, mitochondrial
MRRLFDTILASSLLVFLASAALAQSQYPHLLMGNPSGATEDANNADNYLMAKPYFALSYNNSKGTPNWVSWHLTYEDLGSAKRVPFYPDQELPANFNRVVPQDYTNAGFDRGHMCPHSDRDRTEAMSHATFMMTNIIPQTAAVNQRAWRQLEMHCRMLVEHENKELYIVCGPAGHGGRGKNGFKTVLPKGRVTVPGECWKVILVLDHADGDDAVRIDQNTRLIAVVMPNDSTVGEDWTEYRTSVRDVEALTGFRFFDRVPETVIGPLKDVIENEEVELAPAMDHYTRRPERIRTSEVQRRPIYFDAPPSQRLTVRR